MPELPEVETVKRALLPEIKGQQLEHVICYHERLRYPLSPSLQEAIGQHVLALKRRSKYLIMQMEGGYYLLHLGMSGRLYWQNEATERGKHDHVEWGFASGKIMRLNDPRRFGAVLWQEGNTTHPLLEQLGPEPLDGTWQAEAFHQRLSKIKSPIKTALMNNQNVVGIGNIYANEALFMARIHPLTPANQISLTRLNTLMKACQKVLKEAIVAGGTTLKDFASSDGSKGYFQNNLQVYHQEKCPTCNKKLSIFKLSGRHTACCDACQRPYKDTSQG